MPPQVRRTGNTLFAEPYPRDAFIDNVSDFAENTGREAKIHFYDGMLDLAANAGREYRVGPRQLREELAWNVERYPGTNVRIAGSGYGESIFGWDRDAPGTATGRLTVRAAVDRDAPDFDLDRLLDDFFTDLR